MAFASRGGALAAGLRRREPRRCAIAGRSVGAGDARLRDRDEEMGALARPALDPHLAAVALDDRADDPEAQAGPAARVIDLEIALEDALLELLRDPDPRVVHLELHGHPAVARREVDPSSLVGELDRVRD